MADPTISKFGVPEQGSTPGGILQPKLKFRFRVTFDGGTFGAGGRLFELTQNVQNVTRPKLTHEEVIIDYKFSTSIEILDGKSADSTENWDLEGCFIQNVDYSDTDYSANDPVTITLTLRYDNALHVEPGSTSTVDGRKDGGDMFPGTAPAANSNQSTQAGGS